MTTARFHRVRRLALGTLLGIVALGAALRPTHAQGTVVDSAKSLQTSSAPAPGVDTVLDARVKMVSSRLRCPVCQGESIQDSPAELSAQMRTLVREQLYNGKSEQEVLDYFLQKYGQWILLEPKAEGINLLVYWLPVFFIVIGGGGIAMAVRKWTRPVAVESTATEPLAPTAPPTAP
ncbi:MAG: cytochrome c-type biogenesis protein CcmH [Gemmatimonadaceae bacterium]|nr:cytochrome c-type biogenesis protein CcmH [Gemmatimonadaceae bacterium]